MGAAAMGAVEMAKEAAVMAVAGWVEAGLEVEGVDLAAAG